MSNPCAVTVPLSRIARIQIYVNTRRRTLTQIMRETGADYGINGTLYNMRTLAVNCHLKADGKVLAAPAYTVAGYAWDQGPDIRMDALPNSARSYIACTPLIVSGKALSKLTYDPGQGGKRGRSAIGRPDAGGPSKRSGPGRLDQRRDAGQRRQQPVRLPGPADYKLPESTALHPGIPQR